MSLLIPTNFLTLNILVAAKIGPPIRPQLGKCALQLLFQPERVWCSLSFSWPSVLWLQFLKLWSSSSMFVLARMSQFLRFLCRRWKLSLDLERRDEVGEEVEGGGREVGDVRRRDRPEGWSREVQAQVVHQQSPEGIASRWIWMMTPENIKPISFLFWMMFWSWLNGGRPSVKFVK